MFGSSSESSPLPWLCLQREPFNFTPMAVNSIPSGSPHVRPMGRTCGEPDEIKKIPTRNILPLFFVSVHGGLDEKLLPDRSQAGPCVARL